MWLLSARPGHQFDPVYRRRLAVKTFNDEVAEVDVRRELDVWISLDHANVLPLRKLGSLDFRLAAIMPRLQGSLQDHIETNGCVDARSLLSIAAEVTGALHYAWRHFGVLHLDLKPSNILVTAEDPLSVQVADWGIARISSTRTTSAAALSHRRTASTFDVTSYGAGTPLYMAPERFSDSWTLSPRVDVYSLGLTLLQCATGLLPFSFGPTNPLHEILDGRCFANSTRLLSGVSPDLASFLLSCVHPDPNRRPSDFAEALRGIETVKTRLR